jgi:uncharacterized protein YdeI (YjbR/CyaY-like superfamily)
MKKGTTMPVLFASTRQEWRAWLKKNYQAQREIWLAYPKRHTGRARILYNDAVEEALCFGWIDSTVRALDRDHYAQRFSPRRANSAYSQANLERLHRLIRGKKVIPAIAHQAPRPQHFTFPEDIMNEIRKNKAAWKNYQKFSGSYKRIRIAFIHRARRRPAEFKKRLQHFIEMTEKGKPFGFGGIEKHY